LKDNDDVGKMWKFLSSHLVLQRYRKNFVGFYGSPMTLSDEHKLQVCENNFLRKLFEPKEEEMAMQDFI
jgi:hypothetical protein